jgi:Na+/H+ antiporter NhaD/arsenite permease-like protein
MTASVVAICAAVYLGMILGALPFLQLDRTGIALLGAIALVGTGALSPEQAALSVHLPTLLLLFSFMVIAAQMRLGARVQRQRRLGCDIDRKPSEHADRHIDWRRHARTGVPVTLLTLAITAVWLALHA